jgi:hypothetical protein
VEAYVGVGRRGLRNFLNTGLRSLLRCSPILVSRPRHPLSDKKSSAGWKSPYPEVIQMRTSDWYLHVCRRPRRPLRYPRQLRQRTTSAAHSCERHRARQLKKKIMNTFPTISVCFVLGCLCFVARIYCDRQHFYWAVRLVLGNKRGN